MYSKGHTRFTAKDHCIVRSLTGRKGIDRPIHFTWEGERLRTPRYYHERKRIPTWHTIRMFHGLLEFASSPPPRGNRSDANFGHTMSVVQPLDKNQWPLQLHGHNPWLVSKGLLVPYKPFGFPDFKNQFHPIWMPFVLYMSHFNPLHLT